MRPGAAPGATDEVLLQLRQGTGYRDGCWAAGAAGHVERGETAYDAARREAAEELDVTDVALRFALTMHRTDSGYGLGAAIDERVDFFFTAHAWRGEPRIVEPDKCADLRWFPLDALPEETVPHEAKALRAIAAGGADGVAGPPAYLTDGFRADVDPTSDLTPDLTPDEEQR